MPTRNSPCLWFCTEPGKTRRTCGTSRTRGGSADNGKAYGTTAAFREAKRNFAAADAAIDALNNEHGNAKFGHNQFSDQKPGDWIPDNTGLLNEEGEGRRLYAVVNNDIADLDASSFAVDWRGQMTAVKNQGGCGSCWAFGITSAIEGRIGNGERLSEQQMVDCADDRCGCNGCWARESLMYVDNQGLQAYDDYATGYNRVDQVCQHNSALNSVELDANNGWDHITTTVSDALAALQRGPMPVGVYVDDAFGRYQSGIFGTAGGAGDPANFEYVNHIVTLVGFGVEAASNGGYYEYHEEPVYSTSWYYYWGLYGEGNCPYYTQYSPYYEPNPWWTEDPVCLFGITTQTGTKTVATWVEDGSGTEEIPYWLIQNSWGSGWGDGGFMKIRADAPGTGFGGINAYFYEAFPVSV